MTDENVKDKYKNIPAAKDTVQANIPGITELIRRGKEAAEKSKQPTEQPTILKKDSSKESATQNKPTK